MTDTSEQLAQAIQALKNSYSDDFGYSELLTEDVIIAWSACTPRQLDPGREPNWPLCGYAPGHYMGECSTCKEQMIAAKRAFQCLACAVDTANAAIASLPPKQISEDDRKAILNILNRAQL